MLKLRQSESSTQLMYNEDANDQYKSETLEYVTKKSTFKLWTIDPFALGQ